jgi:predicted DNA-binding transcriptional regulator YafY
MIAPNRPALVRLHHLARKLREGGAFTAGEIARHFEVSRKTITRDLNYLRDRMGYDADWSPSEKRYILHRAPEAQL